MAWITAPLWIWITHGLIQSFSWSLRDHQDRKSIMPPLKPEWYVSRFLQEIIPLKICSGASKRPLPVGSYVFPLLNPFQFGCPSASSSPPCHGIHHTLCHCGCSPHFPHEPLSSLYTGILFWIIMFLALAFNIITWHNVSYPRIWQNNRSSTYIYRM